MLCSLLRLSCRKTYRLRYAARLKRKVCCSMLYDPRSCKAHAKLIAILKYWLVGCFGLNGHLRQYFSLYRAVSQREGERKEKRLVSWLFWALRPFETLFQSISGLLPERGRKKREMIDERKNVQTTPTRTYCKRHSPLLYYHPNCKTPRHWTFSQHHRTTRPPPNQVLMTAFAAFETHLDALNF